MNNSLTYTSAYIFDKIKRKIYTPDTRPIRYAGKDKLNLQEGNDFIFNLLQSDAPFMVARYGSVECSIIKWRLAQKLNLKKEFVDY